MDGAACSHPEVLSAETLRSILARITRVSSVDALLREAVRALADQPQVAMVRVWLVQCSGQCRSRLPSPSCADRVECLRLAASAAGAAVGDYFPPATDENAAELRKAGVCGCLREPLVHRGELLGVLAIYLRVDPGPETRTWLPVIAGAIATGIAHGRALLEIEGLRRPARPNSCDERKPARLASAILGHSAAVSNLLEQIELVAPTDASVLILGESGTGKELVAREIHQRSRRSDRPLVKVNCASIPRELYESEFFGHVRGAFTGALKDRVGRFELADGGTLLLDEFGEIPYELQGKLLRVLQEREFERVGEEVTRQVDVRILAATNRDLKLEQELGRFRRDLFYRLSVFPIEVVPLRQRKEDIPLLAAHFLEQAAVSMNCPQPRLTHADVILLQQYDWPGNVRELRNVIERAVITSRGGMLRFDPTQLLPSPGGPAEVSEIPAAEREVRPDAEMRRLERDNILAALRQARWKIYGPHGAAELLGLRPTTLASRMKRLGIQKPLPNQPR